jgi:hypothetical protein
MQNDFVESANFLAENIFVSNSIASRTLNFTVVFLQICLWSSCRRPLCFSLKYKYLVSGCVVSWRHGNFSEGPNDEVPKRIFCGESFFLSWDQ